MTARSEAVDGARRVSAALESLGIDVLVIGSLANGQFTVGSDVDFLITKCPRHLKYAVESIVEDELHGKAFDVVYLDEIPLSKVKAFLEDAVKAVDLT